MTYRTKNKKFIIIIMTIIQNKTNTREIKQSKTVITHYHKQNNKTEHRRGQSTTLQKANNDNEGHSV